MNVHNPQKRSYTEEEASIYTGMSRSFLRQSRMNGTLEERVPGPIYIKVGSRAIRYLKEDLDAWLDTFSKSVC